MLPSEFRVVISYLVKQECIHGASLSPLWQMNSCHKALLNQDADLFFCINSNNYTL